MRGWGGDSAGVRPGFLICMGGGTRENGPAAGASREPTMRRSSAGMKCPERADLRLGFRDCRELGREEEGTDCAEQVESFSG